METKKFSMGDAVKFGWEAMKGNIGFFIGFFIAVIVIYIVTGIATGMLENFVPFIPNIISLFIEIVITMGLLRVALRFCDGDKGEFGDLFVCYPLFFKYFFSSILYSIIVFGGTLLLIVPGIIWAIKFQFYSYFIVDEGCGPIEALAKSALITQGAKWDLFLFGMLIGLINLLGMLVLVIGLFATVPTTMVAIASVYRTLYVNQFQIAQGSGAVERRT